jgi:hypothetical protein
VAEVVTTMTRKQMADNMLRVQSLTIEGQFQGVIRLKQIIDNPRSRPGEIAKASEALTRMQAILGPQHALLIGGPTATSTLASGSSTSMTPGAGRSILDEALRRVRFSPEARGASDLRPERGPPQNASRQRGRRPSFSPSSSAGIGDPSWPFTHAVIPAPLSGLRCSEVHSGTAFWRQSCPLALRVGMMWATGEVAGAAGSSAA